MILRRRGNKKKLVKKILPYFPKHDLYIEPFFGAGGMFFNKPKAKFNIMNDLDSDVYNLYQVVSNQQEELEAAWHQMPIHLDLWEHWKKHKETDPVKKAVRFLFLSNYGFFGNAETLRYNSGNNSRLVYQNIQQTHDFLFGTEFMNCSFEDMFKKISLGSEREVKKAFIYCDPPYLETQNNYVSGFTETQSFDLFETLQNTGVKWAMSEFDHPFILQQAAERGLNVIDLGERKNLGNRRREILITSYENVRQLNLFGIEYNFNDTKPL
jgi:DNA adenine methylase